jgi:hypothetical protein
MTRDPDTGVVGYTYSKTIKPEKRKQIDNAITEAITGYAREHYALAGGRLPEQVQRVVSAFTPASVLSAPIPQSTPGGQAPAPAGTQGQKPPAQAAAGAVTVTHNGKTYTVPNQEAANSFKTAWQNSISAVKNAIKSIAAPFVAVLNSIVDAWNASFGKFSFTVPSWVPIIGGKKYDGFKLPRINLANLAEGGVVLPSPGGTIARIGEAGRPERVEPLDPEGLSVRDRAIIDRLSGGSGTTVNITVNPSEGMDERELAAIVSRQIAFQLRRGAA